MYVYTFAPKSAQSNVLNIIYFREADIYTFLVQNTYIFIDCISLNFISFEELVREAAKKFLVVLS